MAEILVIELFKVVLFKLADEALKQFVRSQGIHSELEKLEKTLYSIQKLFNDASEKENGDKAVKQWLNSLQHLAYDIDDLLDGLATDAMLCKLTMESGAITSKVQKLIPTCCTSFVLGNRLYRKLDNITSKWTELQDLEEKKIVLGLMEKDDRPRIMSRRYETSPLDASTLIVGREVDKNNFLDKLVGGEACNQKLCIVPIVGMPGVGKTTLARELYNETQVNDHFEFKAWVCVSDDFDVLKISKTIFQEVTRENKEFGNLNTLQTDLIEKLKHKRFLLVLDDVWTENYDDWENLVRPFHSCVPGSKIIMTTRKERLLEMLGFDHIDPLKSLSRDDALSLFAHHALGVDNFESHPTLKRLGVSMVKKCGYLPLALRALGRLLRTKKDEEDWEDMLNSEIWDLDNNAGIVPALRLSYNDLPACLKRVFAYCSLFPKDFVFDRDDLVLLWMAEGFLNESTGNRSIERMGHEYFEMLLSRSFFEVAPNDKSRYVMHDLMNDLATSVFGDYFLRFHNQIEMENEDLVKYRHMSFIRDEYVAYQKFEAFKKAKKLRTFVAVSVGVNQNWDCFYLSQNILLDLLPELPLLRVLCLSGFQISGVPDFIGHLKHLRYLNLSRTKIVALPENMCNLVNLQTLILFGCSKLTKLPNNFLKLSNLRHFDIRDTPLTTMPSGIGEIKSLQTLTNIIIGGDGGFAITELKKLKHLRGKISIKGLENVRKVTHAQMANLSRLWVTELELEWSDGSLKETLEMEVLDKLKPRSSHLEELRIMSYSGIKFPNWVGHASFSQLAHVSIRGCKKCTYLPPLGQLPSLKKLFIQEMDAVKVVDLEFLGTTGFAFPKLEILSFEDMKGWEGWSTDSEVILKAFPCLHELLIKKCYKLVKISLESLPSLKVLKLRECSNVVLRSLVRVASKLAKLEIVDISQLTDEVWRGVIGYLGEVEEIKIEGCNDIRYLWESVAEASNAIMNLRKLVVWNCSNLMSMGEKEGGNYESKPLKSLRNLEIWSCKSMEACSCPNSIETLSIDDCSSLTSVSFPTTTGGRRKLKSLVIFSCEKLLEKELGGEKINNISMPILEYVKIVNWPNLKSSIQLSHSLHLTHLMIEKCPSMESFPDLDLPNLTHLIIFECSSMKSFPDLHLKKLAVLKHMRIRNCPSIDASFPCGNWPPNLWTLEIGGLKKPISEWSHQNFPLSLVELELYGGDVNDFSQLSELLPETLTTLEIKEFEQLESLSTGLEHLVLLQHLIIRKCPKMIHLPEMLLGSLLRLRIIDSPKLKDLTSKRLPYSRHISQIPCIDMFESST